MKGTDGIGGRGERAIALALLVSTGALLALTIVLAKIAQEAGLSAYAFLAWSVTLAACLLGGVGAIEGSLERATGRRAEYALVASLLSISVPNVLFFAAVPHVGASFVALAIAFTPLFTYLAALLLRMERIAAGRALGVGFALAGAAWLAAAELSRPDAPAAWIAAVVIGTTTLAAGNIYRTLRWPPGSTPEGLAPAMMIASAASLVALGLLPGLPFPLRVETLAQVALVGLQGLVFALQYRLFFALQRRGGPVFLSLLGATGALFAVPVAVLALGEALPEGIAIAAFAIPLGILLVARRSAKGGPA